MKMKNVVMIMVAVAGCIGSLVTGANGDTVLDLQGLPDNFEQATWNGGGGSRIYAQSIQTPTVDTVLDSISFNVAGSSAVDMDLIISGVRANVGGLGYAPDFNNILWSQNFSLSGTGSISASPNLNLAPSQLFFASLVGQTASGGYYSVEATAFDGAEQYLPGEFVYLSTSYSESLTSAAINNAEYGHRSGGNEDLAFRASFSAVPEPATLGLLGLVAGGIYFKRRFFVV